MKLPYRIYTALLPKKLVSAGALFFDKSGKILVLKNTYRVARNIPGGVVNAGESPRDGCVREIKEEIGLDVEVGRLLCVDHKRSKFHDSLHFIFDGGVLDEKTIASMKLDWKEIAGSEFMEPDDALKVLSKGLSARIPACLQARSIGETYYLENGIKKSS